MYNLTLKTFTIFGLKLFKMDKKILLIAVLFGMLAIGLGAFGAHALKKLLTSEQLFILCYLV
jgi:hypothetical protein